MKSKIDHLREVYRLVETSSDGTFIQFRGGFDTYDDAVRVAHNRGLVYWKVVKQ
jgi:hypothetical protein